MIKWHNNSSHTLSLFTIFTTLLILTPFCGNAENTFAWTVIGAGPAGIIALATLLENNVKAEDIAWIDPHFSVGRIGRKYANVPGNAKVRDYIQIMRSYKIFSHLESKASHALFTLNPETECHLSAIIEPMQDITDMLRAKVQSYQAKVTELEKELGLWRVVADTGATIWSNKVILATGCHPKKLSYPVREEIPLDSALDKEKLKGNIKPDDIVAVVGDAHSAMLVIKNLYELGAPTIINLYKHPLKYAFYTPNLHSISKHGLTGPVGRWTYEYIERNPIESIIRVPNNQENRDSFLPLITKIIYAIGYQPNKIPCNIRIDSYNSTYGTIAPNLYGIGIAFPETTVTPTGRMEKRIGMNSFMEYAKRVIPQWITETK